MEILPTRLSGVQALTILDFNLQPVTLQHENYTSTWTLPNGEMLSKENPSRNLPIFVSEGIIELNGTNVPSTSLVVQRLSYTAAGMYSCSVQDNRNLSSPPIEGGIELKLTRK